MALIVQHPHAKVQLDPPSNSAPVGILDMRALARQAIADYHAAKFDPPAPDQIVTLDACEAINRLMDQLGPERFMVLARFQAAARGESLT